MEKPLWTIMAFDQAGRVIETNVTLKKGTDNQPIISFGGPMQYSVSTLAEDYPFERPLCIDFSGRMHYGSPVCVTAEDLNKILEAVGVK